MDQTPASPPSAPPSSSILKVGFDERLPAARTGLFGLQHLLALTGIWIFPVLIGSSLKLTQLQVSYIVQGCFLMTGLITLLQSSRLLRLPIVQGPTAAFFAALTAAGATFGLGTAFGSMTVAGLIFMALSVPIRKFGLFGHIARVAATPVVFGTLFVIIGAQLAVIGLPGWFGVKGLPGYGSTNFWISVVTVVVVMGCLVLGGHTLVRRGAVVWGIAAGSLVAAVAGVWSPSFDGSRLLGAPQALPFGFGVEWSVVVLMLLAFLQAGAESSGMYQLIGGWGGEKVSLERTNRGLFTEFLGTTVGSLFGGIGTTSYPENAGIVRITGVGSRYVTATAGAAALVLAFVPSVALFLAGLPGPVLSAASTVLFGIIAMSGVQMLSAVEWDDLNLAVTAPAFIISLGTQFLPADLTDPLPDAARTFVSSPMMLGIVLLIVLHVAVNLGLRPLLERRGAPAPATPATAEGAEVPA
ncbi:uracil-xanthine permease family protein [Streptomyces adonidis]|uniref:uracil-xanthine permease family protein n=1 Tax=Streptomyces adonidis TaxID=3231367 RepID=UPI0034DB494A